MKRDAPFYVSRFTLHVSRFTFHYPPLLSPRRLAILFLLLSGLSVLAAGATQAHHRYLTRGLPAALPEPIAYGGARLGLNVYLEQYDDQGLAAALAEIRALGVAHIKQSFHYTNNYDWAAGDRLVAAVAQSGLTLIPLLDGDPADSFAPPADPAEFAAWAGEFAGRYAAQLTCYIVWDEPNLTTHWGGRPVNPHEYAALLTAASASIRLADPDACLVAAPLAPTVETGPMNLADHLYLQALYEAGATGSFDIVAGKPYGFDTDPRDRTVQPTTLNFSRIVSLREIMGRYGDQDKAIWVGNWGWNSLPSDWQGQPSIWGQVDQATQAEWTAAAFQRARQEWPWMGVMFLENWQPNALPDDPRWGFSVRGRPVTAAIRALAPAPQAANPGFYLARPDDPAQSYQGDWRFSPEFGADISQSGDEATFHFWGTEVGLRVRRADYRARLYVTVDGRPANALPHDENGPVLVLTSASPLEDILTTEVVARNLPPGEHTLHLVAERGWEQWALNGFSVGYRPPDRLYRPVLGGSVGLAILFLLLAIRNLQRGGWLAEQPRFVPWLVGLGRRGQFWLTAIAAALVALTGWLTWGQQAAGLYRRLGDTGQLALTAAAASIFYVAPSFFVYAAALLILFLFIYLRPAWGLALVAFCFPFYVLPKPMLGYRFSPVEVFILVTVAAFLLTPLTPHASRLTPHASRFTLHVSRPTLPDLAVFFFILVATLSLFFAERLDVAINEWRVLIIEPALFYFVLRAARPKASEMWTILDAFALGGLVVAGFGLWQYATGQDLITAEGGLPRLHSIYGSPNNVALYLGRILPLLLAVALLRDGREHRPPSSVLRRRLYAAASLPIGLAILLSFSKGALFLGLPAAGLVLLLVGFPKRRLWGVDGRLWLLLGLTVIVVVGLLVTLQIPALAGRLNPQGETGFFRLNLWRASLNMFADHPFFGVGLDNFLYAYRSRYIFDAAWQEPNLNHPHNIILDFATRLGAAGLLSGGFMLWAFWQSVRRLPGRVKEEWRPVAIGLLAGFADMLAHGLVDHSFFLIDLALAFYLLLGTAAWMGEHGWAGFTDSDP